MENSIEAKVFHRLEPIRAKTTSDENTIPKIAIKKLKTNKTLSVRFNELRKSAIDSSADTSDGKKVDIKSMDAMELIAGSLETIGETV